MSKEPKPERRRKKSNSSSSLNKNSTMSKAKNDERRSTAAAAGPSDASRRQSETSKSEDHSEKQSRTAENTSSTTVPAKRKADSESNTVQDSTRRQKKAKNEMQTSNAARHPPHIRKLAPPRPFPTVPTSVSATGPRSAHTEGKNLICVTRKTKLGMYLWRCKDVILKDGYRTLHLRALGAAIPHLARLVVSLPSILPFAASDIQTEVRTGTQEVQDEIIPDDEDEDISLRTREKSTMCVIIKIEGGDEENTKPTAKKKAKGNEKASQIGTTKTAHANKVQPEQLVFTEEGELEDSDLSN